MLPEKIFDCRPEFVMNILQRSPRPPQQRTVSKSKMQKAYVARVENKYPPIAVIRHAD